MSTADPRITQASSEVDLDASLTGLFAALPSATTVDLLDRRVRRAVDSWQPPGNRRSRVVTRRRVGAIGLLAAALVIGGASGGFHGLYTLLAGPFDVPWHRGTEVGLSQVVDGYRVTIDRAYADATRLALAISVVDELKRPGTTQVASMRTIVTDASGTYDGMGATSTPHGPYAASNVIWKVPPVVPLPSGLRRFEVVIPSIWVRDDSTPPPDALDDADNPWSPWHDYLGPWRFSFEIPVDGATTLTAGASATVDGVTVSLVRLITAPGVVRAELRVEGAPEDGYWGPVGSVRRETQEVPFVTSTVDDDGTIVSLTGGGIEDALGDWTVTVDELVGGDLRLQGPWVLTVPDL